MQSNATADDVRQSRSIAPTCLHCRQSAILTDGRTIYPHRPDLHHKPFWLCRQCDAYVGCHPGTAAALGSPANAATRAARALAHAVFDPLWRSGTMNRRAAYTWLADALAIKATECHIGMMDAETAFRVAAVVRARS